jgi:hypothetical protein
MSDVIDFHKFHKSKTESAYTQSIENHNYVMDICDDLFEKGAVLITLDSNNKVELSISGFDTEEVLEMLVSCAIKIQKE